MVDLGPAFARGGVVGQINKRTELGIARSAVEQKRTAAAATAQTKRIAELKEDTKSLLEIGISTINQANTPALLENARQFAVRSLEGVLQRAKDINAPSSVILAAQNQLDKALSQKEAAIQAGAAKGAGAAAAQVTQAVALAPVVGAPSALKAAGLPVAPEEAAARAGLVAGAQEEARQEAAREAREEAALGITLSPEAQTRLGIAPEVQRPILRLELLAETAVSQGNNAAAQEFRALAKIKASRQASESALGPRATAREREIGTQEARAPERISSINSTVTAIDKALNIISDDPTAVGFISNLRRRGQAGLEFLAEVGLTDTAEQILGFVEENTELSKEDAKGFFSNPNLSQLKLLENQIGIALARLDFNAQGGVGRLPVELIKRSIGSIKLATLSSAAQIRRRLTAIKERFVTARTELETRFGGEVSTPVAAPAIQQPLPVFNITPDGLQQVE